METMRDAKRRRQEPTATTSTATTSTAQDSGSSGEGGPTVGESAPAGPSPTVVDSPVVIPPELDLPGPSGTSTLEEEEMEEEEEEEEEDIPQSASQKKLGKLVKGKLAGEELQGNRVLDISTLASAVENFALCCFCNSALAVRESFENRHGMVSRISLKCTNTNCNHEKLFSDPRSQKAKILNKTSVAAGRHAGMGRRGLQTFTASLDLLPPITARAYSVHNKQIADEVEEVGNKIMHEAAGRVHDFHNKPHDEIIEVGVSMDGTWMKRGHTSQFGALAACDCETGEIVDQEVMCLFCEICNSYKAQHTEKEFEEWLPLHQDSGECQINHWGNSGEMEREAAGILFSRSEEKVKLRYASLLGDGDTNTIKHINEDVLPYGPGFVVTKEECVGHVAKRFYRRLKTARKAKVTNAAGKTVSMQGVNGMTEATSRTMARYYKGAILNNAGDVDGMKKDIFAIFYHTISTDRVPRHEFCPEGEYTWCSYNKYKHEKTKYPRRRIPAHKHKKKPGQKPKIPPKYSDHFKKVFESMSRPELLEGCKRGATQNSNESYHNIIWSMARKTQFCSLTSLRIAMNLAVAKYNLGNAAGVSRCFVAVTGLEAVSSRTMASFTGLDIDRVDHSAWRNTDRHKNRRKHLAMLRSRREEEATEAGGGVSYGPGLAEEDED